MGNWSQMSQLSWIFATFWNRVEGVAECCLFAPFLVFAWGLEHHGRFLSQHSLDKAKERKVNSVASLTETVAGSFPPSLSLLTPSSLDQLYLAASHPPPLWWASFITSPQNNHRLFIFPELYPQFYSFFDKKRRKKTKKQNSTTGLFWGNYSAGFLSVTLHIAPNCTRCKSGDWQNATCKGEREKLRMRLSVHASGKAASAFKNIT